MDIQANGTGVSAVVPAYNEAARIGKVLDILTTYPGFKEVIVVDDGSTDGTGEIAQGYNVKYLRNDVNRGKGYSMDRGVSEAVGSVIFFCDADITGLSHEYIDEIVGPVMGDEVDMFIAGRDRTGNYLPMGANFMPVGGERAIAKRLWQWIPNYFKTNFRIETGLNLYAKYFGKGLRTKVFKGLTQTMKEKKYGFITGAKQRWRLNVDLIQALWRLLFVDSIELFKKGKFGKFGFMKFFAKSLARNVVISAALIASWPVFALVSPIISALEG